MRVETIKLANSRKFGTRWTLDRYYVTDIHKRENSVTLTFKNGANSFKRTFAKWYVELLDRHGVSA